MSVDEVVSTHVIFENNDYFSTLLKNGVYSAYVSTSFDLAKREGTIEVRVGSNSVEWMSLEPKDVVKAGYRSPVEAKAGHRNVVEKWKGKLVGYES